MQSRGRRNKVQEKDTFKKRNRNQANTRVDVEVEKDGEDGGGTDV